ncbi:hypothetical protein EON77_06495, partial [bacterium]
MSIPLALSLVLLGAQGSVAKAKNDDAAVIDAAILQFFTPEFEQEWQSQDWREGETALVHGQLTTKTRSSAKELLVSWIDASRPGESNPEYGARVKEQLAPMRSLLEEIGSQEMTFRPPAIVPLATLDFGPRIAVGEPKLSFRRNWYQTPLPDGKPGRPRVIVWITPPAYSGDGNVAILKAHTLWSMHSADLVFAMGRDVN